MAQPTPKPVVVGTAVELANYVPSKGELTHESDTGAFKAGDGATAHASLPESQSRGVLFAALVRTGVKTANYTLAANDLAPFDTTGGPLTATLPNAPVDKTLAAVKHVVQGGTNVVTVACQGSDVINKSGGLTSFTMPLLGQAALLEYQASTAVWTVLGDDLPLAQLDLRFAPIASPTFTGTVIAPTPTAGDISTKVATTAFVEQRAGTSVALANERVLRDDYRRVYGDIGLAGKAAIALRFDHHLNQFSTTVLPLLQARGMLFGLALYSDMLTTETDSNTIAWADIVGWLASGGEVWSHGKSHQNATAQADIIAEIVTSKATLEASMPTVKIKGWMQPGVATPPYNDFDTTIQASANTYAGQLLRETFALVECDVGSYLRQLPSGFAFGAEHVTVEGQTLAAMQAQVDAAIAYGAGIEYMLHSNFLGQGGYLSVADYTAFLDYLVTKRDAGLLEILTPAGMYAAHPGLSSRIDLINNGDFVGITPAAPGRWTSLSSPWTVLVDPITGYTYASSAAGGTVITQSIWAQEWYRGETFRIEFQARRTDGSTSTTPRIILQDTGDLTRLNSTVTFAAPATGTGWTTYRQPFTFRNDLTNLTVAFGRNGGGSIDIANCHVYKI